MNDAAIGGEESGLDPIQRFRIIAAAYPKAGRSERILHAPYARVWPWVTDLERTLARWEPTVRRAAVERTPDGLMVTTLSPTGRRASLRAVIRDGWCAMEGTQVSIVMAAVPAGAETWFAHLESTRHPAAGAARPLLDLKIRAELRILDRVIRRELR